MAKKQAVAKTSRAETYSYMGRTSVGWEMSPIGILLPVLCAPVKQTITVYSTPRTFEVWSVMMTPELAGKILPELNTCNRVMKDKGVEKIMSDISKKRWQFNPVEPIAIDWHHVLLEGQHQLEAIIRTGIAIPMVIIFNVDPKLRMVVDNSPARKLHEQMRMCGHTFVTNYHTAIARFLMGYGKGGRESNLDVWAVVLDNKKATSFVVNATEDNSVGFRATPVLAALTRAWSFMSESELQRFINVYLGGTAHGKKDTGPSYLREYVYRKKCAEVVTGRRKRLYFTAEACIDSFMHGRAVGNSIPLPGAELFPIPTDKGQSKFFSADEGEV